MMVIQEAIAKGKTEIAGVGGERIKRLPWKHYPEQRTASTVLPVLGYEHYSITQ